MSRTYILSAVILVVLTILTRAVPLPVGASNPVFLAGLLIPVILLSGVVFLLYRKELLRSGKPAVGFPSVMAFITFVFLAQVATRLSRVL